ncbi:MAG: ATP synthase F0 subunit B [Blastopirellula sp.]|nr:MAG: ATP synthase F0 subunit B [Blastopirellula sp.]
MLVRFPIWIVTLFLVLGTASLSVADDSVIDDGVAKDSVAKDSDTNVAAAAKDTETGDPKAADVEASKEEAPAETPKGEIDSDSDLSEGDLAEGELHEKQPEGDHAKDPHDDKKDGVVGHENPDGKEHDADNHNPLDLSHNDPSPTLHSLEEFSFGLATYSFFVFIGLVALLSFFAWKPIMAALDEREKSMDGKIAEAKQMFAEAETKLTEYKLQIANAHKEIQQSRDQMMRDADEKRQQIINDAQAAGKAERDRAKQEIDAAKSQAISELTQQSVNLAVDLAGKIVKKQLSADDHAQLINDAISQLPSRN